MKVRTLKSSVSGSIGCGLAIVCAFVAQPRAAEAQATVSIIADGRRIFVPCANHGLGEWVNLDASIHLLDRDSDLATGVDHVSFAEPSGVGEATGDTYTVSITRNAVPAADGDFQNVLKAQSRGADGVSFTLRWTGLVPFPQNVIDQKCNFRGQAPNILFILADDLGAEATSVYPDLAGNIPQARMPNIEALAANGIVFENAWSDPVCSPARAEIMSGLYGHRTDVLFAGDELPFGTSTIFETIAAQSPESYTMGAFGKWHLSNPSGGNLQEAVDNYAYQLSEAGIPEFQGFIGGGISNYFRWLKVDAVNGVGSFEFPYTQYSTSAITDFAIDFIARHEDGEDADEPWFAYVAYNAPHGIGSSFGFQAPPEDLHSVPFTDQLGNPVVDPLWPTPLNGSGPNGEFQAGDAIFGSILVYQAMIEAMDTEIGRLLDAIGPVGSPERDNTIVVFMGDNGTPWVVKDPSSAVLGHKTQIAEGGVHVPLVISGAGVGNKGRRDDALVDATDMFATLAGLAGVSTGASVDGHSLVPLLTGAVPTASREYAFAEYCAPVGWGEAARRFAIRDGQYKLSYSSSTDGDPYQLSPLPWLEEAPPAGWGLYDLQNDRGETSNLIDTGIGAQQDLEYALELLRQNATYGCFDE